MTRAENITELIGGTPLLHLAHYEQELELGATLLAKLEYFNPAGSIKDRTAMAMVDAAEASGQLKAGGTIIEPTSGNTGIGLAMIAAARGYELVLTMPETMSIERRQLLEAYGARIVLTKGAKGMKGAIECAEMLAAKLRNSFMPAQFDNPANPSVHYHMTGPEIFDDAGGAVDYFVAGVGTGGTMTGVGKYLREKNPAVHLCAVEPAGSPVLSQGIAGPHKIQGIGAGFVPSVLDTTLYNEIALATDNDAFAAARLLAKTEGVLVGISSGAALWAATRIAQRVEATGKTIVVVFPDTGERYLSMGLFAEQD